MILGHLLSNRGERRSTGGNGIPPNNPQPQKPGSNNSGNQQNSPNETSGTAKKSGLVIALVIVAIVLGIALAFSVVQATSSSSVEREPLPADAVVETAYFTDEDGDWIDNPAQLEEGLEEFYQLTGIQPYVYILPNGSTTSTTELANMAEELYGQLFSDQAHFLLVFCDDNNGGYNCGYWSGSQTAAILDDEAINTLARSLEEAYADLSLTEEEIFSEAFANTAKRIMDTGGSAVVPLAIALVVVVVAIVVLVTLQKRREQRELEQQRMEKILSTPLEQFGDAELEELEKKYANQ